MFLFDLILNYYMYSLFLFYYSHLEDLIYQNKKEKLCPIRKTFFNKKDYANHQINLIQEEIEEIQKDNELPHLVTLYLKFDYPEKNKCVITIDNPYFKIFKKIPLTFIKKMN